MGNDADPPNALDQAVERLKRWEIQAQNMLGWPKNRAEPKIPLGPWSKYVPQGEVLERDPLSSIAVSTTQLSKWRGKESIKNVETCRAITKLIMLADAAGLVGKRLALKVHLAEPGPRYDLQKMLGDWADGIYRKAHPNCAEEFTSLPARLRAFIQPNNPWEEVESFEAEWRALVKQIRLRHDPGFPKPQPETPSAPQALASDAATQTTQNLSVREQLAIIFTQHPALRDYLADELRAKLPPCQVNDIRQTVETLVDFIYAAEVGQRLLDLATYQRKALEAGKTTAAQELHWLVRWFLPWVETLPLAQADGPIIELPPTTWAMVERAVAQADRREMRVCLGQASDGHWVIGQTALLTADISPTQPDAWIKGIEEQLGGVLPLMGRNPMSLADALEVAEASQQAAQTAQFLPADALVPFYVIIARERPQDRSGEQYWLGQYRGLRLVYLPQRSYGEPQSDTRKVTLKIEEALGTLLRGSQPRSLR